MDQKTFAIFDITDGITTVDLIAFDTKTGVQLRTWAPQVTQPKEGGVWTSSAISEGRRPVAEYKANVVEDLTVDIIAWNDDDLYEKAAQIRMLLEKARRYWMTRQQGDGPVWIKRQAFCETNPGYDLVMAGICPEENDPFHAPVTPEGGLGFTVAYLDWPIQIEREPLWRDTIPGEDGTCLPTSGYRETTRQFWYFAFDVGDITIPDNAAIQDLHDDKFTVEVWVKPDSWGSVGLGHIVRKGDQGANAGWIFRINYEGGLEAYIWCAVTDAYAQSGPTIFFPDETWHHVALTWDDATYNYPRLWIDGKEAPYFATQNRNGAVVTDVGDDMIIANDDGQARDWDGGIGWVRVSSAIRYNTEFTPPQRCVVPADDADTVGMWIGEYGDPGSCRNLEGTGAIDGTLNGSATITLTCEAIEGKVLPPCRGVSALEFNGDDSWVQVADHASIQDLQDDKMTVECWVKTGRYGETGVGRIASKGDTGANVGWTFHVDSAYGLQVQIECAVVDARTRAGLAAFTADYAWHHVAFTWDDAVDLFPQIWVDGVEQSNATQNRNGVIQSDVGDDLYIGNDNTQIRAFEGLIGWFRISNSIRYADTFCPPPHCVLPQVDAYTVVLEIHEGHGIVAKDHSINGNDGDILRATWAACDCQCRWDCSSGLPFARFDGEYSQGYLVTPSVDGRVWDDNLPVLEQGFTVEAWVRFYSWGENNEGRIFDKTGSGAAGWRFYVDSTNGLQVDIQHATTDGSATSGTDDIEPDGCWHHLAFTWDPCDPTPKLWIDGSEPSYVLSQAAVGAYARDDLVDTFVGNRSDLARTFYGDFGWMRISSGVRYAATFTPPSRCVTPTIDPHTLGLYNHRNQPMYNGTSINLAAAAEDSVVIDLMVYEGVSFDYDADCGCVEEGRVYHGGPAYLTFDGCEDHVQVVDDASIQDLHDAAMTVEAWIRPRSYGEGDIGRIVCKGDTGAAVGWLFRLDSTWGLIAQIECAVTDGRTRALLTGFAVDNGWHHVAFTWDDATYNFPRLWVDGVEQSNSTQTRNGAVLSDVGDDLFIGNISSLITGFDGDIGWLRISDSIRYTVGFTAPSRCTLPAYDTNTVLLEIYEGEGYWTRDLTPNENDGEIKGPEWDYDCPDDDDWSRCDCLTTPEYTCVWDTVLQNKDHDQQLTHVFRYDAGTATYSTNLLGQTLPYPLLPPLPLTLNDACYFGIEQYDATHRQPFHSLVFNMYRDRVLGSAVIEYWNGAWVTLVVGNAFWQVGQGRTNHPFLTPDDWVVTTVNGVTGYWVRIRVSNAASTSIPWVSAHPAVITWSNFEVEEGAIGGDVPALIRYNLSNLFGNPSSGDADLNRIIFGARSVSRGEDFRAYINLAPESTDLVRQNPDGITMLVTTPAVTITSTADPTCPNGYRYRISTAAGVPDTATFEVVFDADAIQTYQGTYHAYVRGWREDGEQTDFESRLIVRMGGPTGPGLGTVIQQTDPQSWPNTQLWQLLDFGRIVLPGPDVRQDQDILGLSISVEVTVNTQGIYCDLVDLILIPVDELAGDIQDTDIQQWQAPLYDEEGETTGERYLLDLDSIRFPKYPVQSLLSYEGFSATVSYGVYGSWLSNLAGHNVLQVNEQQRVWCLMNRVEDVDSVYYEYWEPWLGLRVQAWKVQRYESGRGSR